MNKWQIICPLAAITIIAVASAVVFAAISGKKHHRHYVHAQTEMIGRELVATTNSPRLSAMGSGLRGRLPEFLATSGGVADVLLGDAAFPVGDGAACSRLTLTNATGARLVIRLCQDAEPERFHVLGYWTVSGQNGSQMSQPPAATGSGR